MKGLMGRKLGMMQVFLPDGRMLPVTVISVEPNTVIQKKTTASKDGYNAVKLGIDAARKSEKEGTEPRWHMNRAGLGVFKHAGIGVPCKTVREFRLTEEELALYPEVGGAVVAGDLFRKGQFVDLVGTSKGRGFTGVMRRHNMAGAKGSHGAHEYFRHGGSIGSSADPSRVFKGKRMAGQHGNARVTVQSLQVVDVLADKNLVLIKGGVPGPNGGMVMLQQSVKKRNATKAL